MDIDSIAGSIQHYIGISAMVSTAYVLTLGTLNLLAARNSRSISNQHELEQAVDQELMDRELCGRRIVPVFNWDNGAAQQHGGFELNATSEYLVRHELGHILDGHLDSGTFLRKKGAGQLCDLMLYLAYYEPKATLSSIRWKDIR